MILAVDAGNTHIVIGCTQNGTVSFTERISTNRQKTEFEYALDFKVILELHQIAPGSVEGGIISSVVPQLSPVLCRALEKIISQKPLIVGPGVKTGLKIMIDNPAQLGSDLAVSAVAALASCQPPLIVIDMGTATTFSVIDHEKRYLGGAIVPGAVVALNSLSTETSQLPHISLEAPQQVIGTNTVDCMKSGTVLGNASMIDGMIDRIEEQLHESVSVIATGGIARHIIPFCRHSIFFDDDLMLKGLDLIYQKNRK